MNFFPSTPSSVTDSRPRLHIGSCDLADLVETYGTPLYLYDQATMDAAVDQYRRSLAAHYPAQSRVTYAGKAALMLAIAQWVRSQDLDLDCTGIGEIHIAVWPESTDQICLSMGSTSPRPIWRWPLPMRAQSSSTT